MKKISKQAIKEAEAFLAKGLSVREIAKRTGVSKSKVGELRKKMGLDNTEVKTGRPTKLSETDDRAISY